MMGNPYAKIAVFLVALGLASLACRELPTQEDLDREAYGNVQTAAASARNYDLYWLGRAFVAGGLTYKGPGTSAPAESGGIGQNDADRLELSYLPVDCSTVPDISITLHSKERPLPRTPTLTREPEAIQVNGRPAELWTVRYSPGGEIASFRIIVEYETTVVDAIASPFAESANGPCRGAVMDKATFLGAMQNLRPYPQ